MAQLNFDEVYAAMLMEIYEHEDWYDPKDRVGILSHIERIAENHGLTDLLRRGIKDAVQEALRAKGIVCDELDEPEI